MEEKHTLRYKKAHAVSQTSKSSFQEFKPPNLLAATFDFLDVAIASSKSDCDKALGACNTKKKKVNGDSHNLFIF